MPEARRARRPRDSEHLYLRNGVWWTRICEVRKSTGIPKSEMAAARQIRDRRVAEFELRRQGISVEQPLPVLTLAQLIERYVKAESQPYDREKGGEQEGTKRSARTDGFSRDRVLKHLDGKMLASAITAETIVLLAERIAREPNAPAKATRKKHLAFFRRVLSWAAERPTESGIRLSPFAQLTKQQRKDFFPKTRKRGHVFTAEQLQGLYDLAGWRRPLIRFAVHTGMRYGELTTLRWSCVNLNGRHAVVEARYAKNGQERTIPLGDVAFGILESLSPDNPKADGLVFTKPDGTEILTIKNWWNRAVLKVWTPSRPSEQRPRFHDFRKTGGTRVEAVSSHAVAKRFLGHADEDVTDSYIIATDEAVREATNRAARLIDGVQVGNVVQFQVANGTPDGTAAAAGQ